MNKPEIGRVYYEVTFVDTSLRIPRVEPMVFLGENLFPDHEDEGVTSYYFRKPAVDPENEINGGQSVGEYYS